MSVNLEGAKVHLRRVLVAAAATLAVSVIPATVNTASAAPPRPDVPSGVTVGTQEASEQEVRDFWTPARMREAVKNEKKDQAAVARAAAAAQRADAAPSARPETGPKASADAVAPAGRSLPGAAPSAARVPEMSVSERVPYPTSFPNVVVGKVFSYDDAGKEHACSAASIVSDNRNTVWTAGHCVHPGDGSGADGFHDLVVFIPGYQGTTGDDYQAPWGEWVAKVKVAPEQWTHEENYLTADLAAFTVTPPDGYGNLADSVGALGYKFGDGSDFDDVIDYGYPGVGYQRTDLDGKDMLYCTGNVVDAVNWFPLDNRLEMDCDMGEGASGGPMFTPSWQLVGANSHHDIDDNDQRVNDNLYSSEHGSEAVKVIDAINEEG
ncbi:trypsin-like peptidase domain-containing protein [Streptomyces sp. NPDC021622]|uniref:trypsin-like serine peptidase n=1 Tax=Streptomyces sp. NPDC021622 TaxID=3155013 RepID=UPI0033CCF975